MKILTKHWHFLLVIGLTLLTIWPLILPGYFSHHDDLHVIRILEMRKCFIDLQIPCRWVPDMGWGYGYPLFNYYNPFIYYLGALLSYIVGFVWSSKILFLIGLILGPVGMYFFARELWNKTSGIVAGALFVFVPYRALDAYVRGALAELFAISLLPLLFLFLLRLIKQGKIVNFLATALLIAIFLVTHNVSVIIWSPFIILWIVYCLYRYGFKNIKLLVLSFVIGFGLSAFFVLPAYSERSLVSSETLTQGDLDYHVHFATLRQLFFDRFWGYGASKLGPNDDLSMQTGWPYWWIVIISGAIAFFAILKSRNLKDKILPLFLVVFFFASVFMTHNKSTFIWDNLSLLKYIQFPWRFLGVAAFSTSLLGGYLVSRATKYKVFSSIVIIVAAGVLNWNYFRPEKFYFDVNDKVKLSGALWEEQQKGAILDYLPKSAVTPAKAAPTQPVLISGNAKDITFEKTSNSWVLKGQSSGISKIELPIFNFPNWNIARDSSKIETSKSGMVIVSLGNEGENGSYYKSAYLKDTTVRTLGNLITFLSFILLLVIVRYAKNRKIFS